MINVANKKWKDMLYHCINENTYFFFSKKEFSVISNDSNGFREKNCNKMDTRQIT